MIAEAQKAEAVLISFRRLHREEGKSIFMFELFHSAIAGREPAIVHRGPVESFRDVPD
jgi:hypothetical protein